MGIRARAFATVILLVVPVTFWLLGDRMFRSDAQSERGPSTARGVMALLDKRASDAVSGDEPAIRRFADTVFDVSPAARALPEGVAKEIKERFIKAEMNYRTGRRGPVTETALVNTINRFVDSISAPQYAKISLLQVRQQRVAQSTILPHFVAATSAGENRKIGSWIGTEMSPLEAAHIALSMATLKMFNESYQVTPEEWAANFHLREVQEWESRKNDSHAGGGADLASDRSPKLDRVSQPSARLHEIEKALDFAVQAQGAAGIMTFARKALDDLGIER